MDGSVWRPEILDTVQVKGRGEIVVVRMAADTPWPAFGIKIEVDGRERDVVGVERHAVPGERKPRIGDPLGLLLRSLPQT